MGFLRRLLLFSAVFGAGGSVPLRAEADPGLTWIAETGCSPGARERVASLLALHKGSGVTARVEVTSVETGVRLDVRVQTGAREQHRVLLAPTCAMAVDAASFFLSISLPPDGPAPTLESALVEPSASSAPSSPPVATEPGLPAEPPPSPPSADVLPSAHRAGEPPARFALDAFASTESGALPMAVVSFGGALAFRPHRLLRLELDGAYSVSETSTLASGPGGTFSVLGLGVRACIPIQVNGKGESDARSHPRVGFAALEIAPCVGAHVEEISGTGVKVDVSRPAQAWSWGPEAGLFARLPLSRALAVRFGVAASAPLSRPHFVIDRVGVVDQAWPVELRIALGPEVRF
jgi:hypothetical protein